MNKQDGATAPRTILRTDRPSPVAFGLAGAGAGGALIYMAAGMPVPTGIWGLATGLTLTGMAIGLVVSETIADLRRPVDLPVPPPVRPGSVRVVAGRTSRAPIRALTCENEELSEQQRCASNGRRPQPASAVPSPALPGVGR